MLIGRVYEGEDRTQHVVGYWYERFPTGVMIGFSLSKPHMILFGLGVCMGGNPGLSIRLLFWGKNIIDRRYRNSL